MSQLGEILGRLERVLSLAERRLRDLTGSRETPLPLEQHHAFRWDESGGVGCLEEIMAPARFDLDDLIGVDRPLESLIRNTEQFLEGLPCNHVLLHGERGTGKSSAVKGLLERYAERGLRLVEVNKSELAHLPRILNALRVSPGAEDYRFVLFCDDLSFGQGEPGYRELKAALEGSFAAPAENVCIVATSNRRHLLPETMAENREARVDEDGELHLGEALEEKLALSDRFGLVLGFYSFDQKTYLAIVEHYVEKLALGVSLGDVRADALRWALERASRSGRTARHFVNDLAGRLGLSSRGSA